MESLRRIRYAASFLTQISSLPSRAVKSFQDGSSAFHVEATVLQVDPQNVQVSRLNRRQNFPHSPGRCALVSHIMANDSSNETQRFSTYLTVPTDCKKHEFARQAVQGNEVRPCGRVSLLLFRALKVVVNCQKKTLNPKPKSL